MKIISVSHPRNFSFPVGTTIVKFAAEDIEGTQKVCSVLVDVLGKFILLLLLHKKQKLEKITFSIKYLKNVTFKIITKAPVYSRKFQVL